jgi:hypothetical protein
MHTEKRDRDRRPKIARLDLWSTTSLVEKKVSKKTLHSQYCNADRDRDLQMKSRSQPRLFFFTVDQDWDHGKKMRYRLQDCSWYRSLYF